MYGYALFSRKSTLELPKSAGEAARRYTDWHDNPRRRSSTCKLAHNTYLECAARASDGSTVYAVRLHDTRIVHFNPNGDIMLDTGGWQTPTTRARMRECGVNVGMAGGVAGVRHGGAEYAYRDSMTLHPDGTATYFGGAPAKLAEPARTVRRRELARIRRRERAGDFSESAWKWDSRSGGHAHGGNAPEAFES